MSELLMQRRAFLGSVAAGSLVLAVGATEAKDCSELTAWVVVQPDDSVVVRIARSEMGQGTLTGLAQLVAEEMDADWRSVRTEYPTPGQSLKRQRPWGSFSTGGSRGVRDSQAAMRKGGAQARAMLLQAAATQWAVPAAECGVCEGVVSHAASKRSARFGQLASSAAQLSPPLDVVFKDPKQWRLAGKPLARLDTRDKTNGKQVYGADLVLPGMLNAAIKDCPVFGGSIKSVNEQAVLSLRGVKKVVRVGNSAVAVVADTWWRAKKALDALPIEWDLGPHASVQQADIDARNREGLSAEQAAVGNTQGQALEQLALAARRIEAEYSYPFQHHVTMETMNATARWTPERCVVWTPTQNGEGALAATAEAAGSVRGLQVAPGRRLWPARCRA
jgi:isoquinoline 1-oxidoreductase subunit beta